MTQNPDYLRRCTMEPGISLSTIKKNEFVVSNRFIFRIQRLLNWFDTRERRLKLLSSQTGGRRRFEQNEEGNYRVTSSTFESSRSFVTKTSFKHHVEIWEHLWKCANSTLYVSLKIYITLVTETTVCNLDRRSVRHINLGCYEYMQNDSLL